MKSYYLYTESVRDVLGEIDAAREVFGEENMGTLLTEIPENRLVIPRFRAIPFGADLEREVANRGSALVNSYHQHRNIADIFAWCGELEGLTPPCFTVEDVPYLPEGKYFVKGETNSKKGDWLGSAYAPSKAALVEIMGRLRGDSLLGHQRLVIRPFQEFRRIGEAITGQPIFHERRAFILHGELLTHAYYWSSHVEELGVPEILHEDSYWRTLDEAISRVKHLAPFVVIDLAEYPDGSWAVVELNDGSMSGLSENDPRVLWRRFLEVAEGWE